MKKQSKADKMDESLGMRRGKESKKKQSYKSRRDESTAMKKNAKKKAVKGTKYVAADEVYDRATRKKEMRGMDTPGIAVELNLSLAKQGYSNMPRVKPQKKTAKLTGANKKR